MSQRLASYRHALKSISLRTGTPLPSLIISFGILHEVTAIVPLVGIFYGSRALGVGERLVNVMAPKDQEEGESSWLRNKLRGWVKEGDRWAKRVGMRYGIFGFEKSYGSDRDPEESARETSAERGTSQGISGRIAGDAANAVVAYALTKALLPLRIGLSLYLCPGFSRSVVEPVGRMMIRPFKR